MAQHIDDLEVLVDAHAKRIARLERLQLTASIGATGIQKDMSELKTDVRSLLDERIATQATLKSIRILVATVPVVVSILVWVINHIH